MKKFLSFAIAAVLLLSLSFSVSGADKFSDVPEGSKFYKAVTALSKKNIISGYEDGTFLPGNTITRAEAATIIVRAGGFSADNAKKSIYKDVPDSHWGRKYIMTATEEGILSGMGGGIFAPDDAVTCNQIIKMIVCLMGLENDALSNGGWPRGYLKTAYSNGIITLSEYNDFLVDGNKKALRGYVALYIYNAVGTSSDEAVTVGDKSYFIDMSSSSLSTPYEILPSTYGFEWYIYGTDTYKNFIALGIKEGKVVALASSGKGFTYSGYSFGDNIDSSDNYASHFLTDKNANGTIHSVFILSAKYNKINDFSQSAFEGESKLNFHATNAFRVAHGKKALKWSDKAAKAAYLHSKDMAEKNYFSHDSKDGRKFYERLKAQGISYRSCGENISAGRSLGFLSYNGWVNSSGHRENMLEDYNYLGVGAAYEENSTYGAYFTQDFYS
ncbi:MAG: S-layer homology domain-containing protein [Clostridia bacterium]|nr:S-layer homology domain-containing protein [Clostridia bacterium]